MRTEVVKPLLACVALVVLCAILLVLSGCGRLPTDDPKPALLAWVPVNGKSMLPTFPEKGFVEMEFGFPYEALQIGDTVIYWDYKRGPAAFTHHRLIERQGPWWIARGDNPETNPVEDRAFVTKDNFIARGTGRSGLIIYRE